MSFFKPLDLTTALRPAYLQDEVLLFVQDNVGLYEGKYKLPNQQDGQVYLTSHRVCYVDKAEPRKFSVAIELKEVDKFDLYTGFLKSSPKVTIYPKLPARTSAFKSQTLASTTSRTTTASTTSSPATWVCTICSFSNLVPSNFDPSLANEHTPLSPCLACGIKPTLSHVLKAAIANATKRPQYSELSAPTPLTATKNPPQLLSSSDPTAFHCPRCTFANHPSLMSCEICGAPLVSQNLPPQLKPARTESPGPTLPASDSLLKSPPTTLNPIKFSFRGGGEKSFHERLKNALTQRKWLLSNAPPIPSTQSTLSSSSTPTTPKTAGIAAIEQKTLAQRTTNAQVIGNAFSDLETLMSSAREIVTLAESFARTNPASTSSFSTSTLASTMGLITTKDIAGTSTSHNLYLSELARTVAEYLTDDARGILRAAGGAITLVDLWALFNRARGTVELVSPHDFAAAAALFPSLNLPLCLRTFRSGVQVIQSKDRTEASICSLLTSWLLTFRSTPPSDPVPWDWQEFGRGVTAREVAEHFGWSLGVAEEELEMAEGKGVLCREEGLEGVRFWSNYIGTKEMVSETVKVQDALKKAGLL